ncbi:MAG: hypothetical protein K6A92_11510 [Lachnospiraceae bacterium]|nr:hypothetical protein [Lachnospiraceae bacterium]
MKQRQVVTLLLGLLFLLLVGMNALLYFHNTEVMERIEANTLQIRDLQADQVVLQDQLKEEQDRLKQLKEKTDKLQEAYEKRQDAIRLMQDTLLLRQLYVEEKRQTVTCYHAAEKIDGILLTLHNDFRSGLGLQTLKTESFLEDVATLRSEEAHEVWSHTRPDGSWCLDLIPQSRPAAENLSYIKKPSLEETDAYCRAVAEKLFQSLLDSPTHYDNIVKANVGHIGIRTYVTRETEDNNYQFTTAYIFSN